MKGNIGGAIAGVISEFLIGRIFHLTDGIRGSLLAECFSPWGCAKMSDSPYPFRSNLFYNRATSLSSPSDLPSLLQFPFCLPHFPHCLLSGLINNEWSRSSIDPILFVLAQQKISHLSEDTKITLRCSGRW